MCNALFIGYPISLVLCEYSIYPIKSDIHPVRKAPDVGLNRNFNFSFGRILHPNLSEFFLNILSVSFLTFLQTIKWISDIVRTEILSNENGDAFRFGNGDACDRQNLLTSRVGIMLFFMPSLERE